MFHDSQPEQLSKESFTQCNLLNAEINCLFIIIFSFCPLSREAGDIGADKGAQGGGAGP